jgi:hypothetical protein
MADGNDVSREHLAELLNEDLAREYQGIIGYVVYSQVLSGPQYMDIATQLEIHAKQELDHALIISPRSHFSIEIRRDLLSEASLLLAGRHRGASVEEVDQRVSSSNHSNTTVDLRRRLLACL